MKYHIPVSLWAISGLLLMADNRSALAETLNENHRTFADSLTSELYTNDNECTSSWGVSMAFSLVYPGSTNDAETQIRDVFRYPPGESKLQLLWNSTAESLTSQYTGECTSMYNGECERKLPTLKVANSVWIDTDTMLNTSYQKVVGDYVEKTDFEDNGAGGMINQWVEQSTNGLIDSIIKEGPLFPPYVLLAINSIYLNASWVYPFYEGKTNEDMFYTSASRDTALDEKAQFMHLVEFFGYSDSALPGYQILELPFQAGALSMLIVLPTSTEVEESGAATSTSILEILPELESTRMSLALPKFKFESEYKDNLKATLQNLGMPAPFEDGALCHMFEGFCGLIDFVIQKTHISVHEKGTEAAAVTAIGVIESAAPNDIPVLFMADHPFQFFIYDEEEDLVLFEGRVGAPSIPDDAPAAQLQAKHADANFWTETFGVDPADPIPLETNPPTTTQSSSSSITKGNRGVWVALFSSLIYSVLQFV